MENLGRRRKLEVRGGSGHHFPTSNVQQSHQANPDPIQGPGGTEFRRGDGASQLANPLRILRYKKCHLGFALPGLARVWVCLVLLLLLHLLGRQVTAKTSAGLWLRPLTPYSIAVEDVGASGTSCEAIGVVLVP